MAHRDRPSSLIQMSLGQLRCGMGGLRPKRRCSSLFRLIRAIAIQTQDCRSLLHLVMYQFFVRGTLFHKCKVNVMCHTNSCEPILNVAAAAPEHC